MSSKTTLTDVHDLFVRQGWSEDIELEELSAEDLSAIGVPLLASAVLNGKQFFRMKQTGDIFDSKGNVVVYSIPCCISTPVS